MNTAAASRRKILRNAVAPVLETLEGRTYMTAVVAHFTDGNGTAQIDQYAGKSGSGWAGAWQVRNSNSSFTTATVTNTSPLNSGGNYLSATMVASGGSARGAFSRGYNTTGNVDTGGIHQVQMSFRVDSALTTFTDADDRVQIFGDTAARFGPTTTDTLLAIAFGASNWGVGAKSWGLADGANFIDSGVTLTQGTVYQFTFLVDPANDQYQATVSDGQAGTGHTYTSGWLDWDNPGTFTSSTTTYIEAGARVNGTTESISFSVDTIKITPPPPAAPSGFTATAASTSQINLGWTDNATTETGFVIERSIDNSSWTSVTTTAAGATSYSNTGLSAGTLYYYRVRATNEGGDSSNATASATTTSAPPAAPTGLSLTVVSGAQINLTWTDNSSNETGFVLQRKTGTGGSWSTIASPAANATFYADMTVAEGTTYYYQIAASGTGGNSSFAASGAATTALATPATVSSSMLSPSKAQVTWSDSSSYETGYQIERKTDSGEFVVLATVAANSTFYNDLSVHPGASYSYRVAPTISGTPAGSPTTGTASTDPASATSYYASTPGGEYINNFGGYSPNDTFGPEVTGLLADQYFGAGPETYGLIWTDANQSVTFSLADLPKHNQVRIGIGGPAHEDSGFAQTIKVFADGSLVASFFDNGDLDNPVYSQTGIWSTYEVDSGLGYYTVLNHADSKLQVSIVSNGSWSLRQIQVKTAIDVPVPPYYCPTPIPRIAPGADGGNPGMNGKLAGPIRGTGQLELQMDDFEGNSFAAEWGQSRTWSNMAVTSNGAMNTPLPYVTSFGSDPVVITSAGAARLFTSGSSRFFLQESLGSDAGTHTLTFTDSTGARLIFNDLSTYWAVGLRGQLQSSIDLDGVQSSVTRDSSTGRVTKMERARTVASVTTTDALLYEYVASGANAGQILSVTSQRKIGSGGWITDRSVTYTYYVDGDANGNAGDLASAVAKDGAGNELNTQYYRYYTDNTSGGYKHGLKYLFGAQSYARAAAALGTLATATDSQLTTYADYYFEYDGARRVTKATVQGEGCSTCTGGQGSYTYSYGINLTSGGINAWRYKVVETLPDGNSNTTYSNAAGEVILKIFTNVGSSQQFMDFWKYDAQGRTILHANPSAVTGYSETYLDLVHWDGDDYQYIADTAGLLDTYVYYDSTTATSSVAGAVSGYLYKTGLQQGEFGTAILQSTDNYYKRQGADATIYVLANHTVYSFENSIGASTPIGGQTTSYSYTWNGTTTQMASMSESAPVVSAARNGSGAADVTTSYFDSYGRMIWAADGDGYITYMEYDTTDGSVIRRVTDANPSLISSPPISAPTRGSGLPTALHLQTTYVTTYNLASNGSGGYLESGRTIKETDPKGNVTYTVYNDANYEVRTYRGWNATTGTTTGPIEVYRENRPGSYTETLTISATAATSGSSGNYVPTGTESIGSLQSLSRTYTSSGGQVTETRAYFNLAGLTYSTAANLGTSGTHYYATIYAYDQRGRLKRTLSPTGTINWTLYDGLGRTKSTWVGTDDNGAVNGDPTGGGASGNNMQKVTEYQYDNGGVGHSNLTKLTQLLGGSATNRVSEMYYDWRNRQVASKAAVEASESTGDNTHFISYTDYNNLNQATISYVYDGDVVTITSTSGVPNQPSSSLLRAKQMTEYDEQGRVFRSTTYSVNPTNGNVSSAGLVSNSFYDQRGNVIKSSQPGGLVGKMVYDGAGRLTKSYTTDGSGDATTVSPYGTWSSASNVTGDIVLEQSETEYDDAGNAILSTTRQRFHDATDTGELGTPSSTSGTAKARVSYAAMYYDAGNRLTDQVDVGTNGGSSYTRPGSVPSRSDTALVTSYEYDTAGRLKDVIDPKAIKSRTLYDALGRTTKTIANYVDGTPSDADDQTTSYTYDGAGNVLTLKAELPSSVFQETKYIYQARTSTGSDINSNDILSAVQYPDLSSGSASSGQQETFTVNALGQTKTKTDRNGSVHTYSYDVLGRQTTDAVTTLGSGVDGAIRRLVTEYDTQGNAFRFTSYDAASGGSVVNQVQRAFNGLGQLTTEYQAVNGSVNTSTTPKVQYAYTEMASGANHSRLTSMTYPNGRVLNYNYASGLDTSISRLTSLSDSSATLESLTYLGLGTVVERNHPQSGVNLTYIGTPGDAGDQYSGLDRFGRVTNQNWKSGSTTVDGYTYGYDRNGNRLYKENTLSSINSELYAYDNLNRLTSMSRGTLNGTKTALTGSATRSQTWDLDALGNSDSVTTDSVTQTRAHNKQNELTQMGSSPLTFDANGNQTTDETGKTFVYDAWNHLKEAKSGSTSLIVYSFDALGRRVIEGTTRIYYSAQRQEIEDRNASGVTTLQLVYSPIYQNALIERDRDTDADGTLDERLYYLQDANFNVTALASASGTIVQRARYDAYGAITVLTASWMTTTEGYANPLGFQGGKADVVTGYIHFDYRELNTAQMRWVQQDPLKFIDGMNLYNFAASCPVCAVDPTGLKWVTGRNGSWWIDYQKTALGGIAQVPIVLNYAPAKEHVCCTEVRLLQIVKLTLNGKTVTGEHLPEHQAISSDGWAIDQLGENLAPYYDPKQPGLSGAGSVCTGQGVPFQWAWIWDRPTSFTADLNFDFITFAVCAAGKEKGKVLDGLKWGFLTGADAKHVRSLVIPTPTSNIRSLRSALEAWRTLGRVPKDGGTWVNLPREIRGR